MSDLATVEDLDRVGKTVETAVLSMTSAVEAQTAAMDRLAQAMSDQRHVESARASGGSAKINIEAGGVAIWIAATCCIVTVVSCGFLALALLWVAIKVNDMGHQQNAVYQSVPGLRELVTEQIKLNEQASNPQQQDPKE